MTRGSFALRKVRPRPQKIADALGVDLRTVQYWRKGDKPPGPAARARIHELYDIPPAWWDEPIEADTLPIDGIGEAGEDARSEAENLLAMVRTIRDELQRDPDMPPGERIRALGDAARVMTAFGKFTGASLTVSLRQILASPHWRELMVVIYSALTPWPAAMAAVGDALAALDGGAPSDSSPQVEDK